MIKAKHLLGMNARNLLFIQPSNPKHLRPLVDNKLKCKSILDKANIPTPKIYKVFRNTRDVETFDWKSLPNSFVVKPNMGFGGEGILLVFGKKKNTWVRQDGAEIDEKDIIVHILDILDGNYSLTNVPDIAFIEQKVKTHRAFRRFCWRGTPDIRVIVYNKVPVIAMFRLPTHESGGRANIHQGAIGVGVDISTGITTTAVWHHRNIRLIPGAKIKLHGFRIPFWETILRLASEAQQAVGLGYLGVDIVIDRDDGPQVLELNARPGLGIQEANATPLKRRLERVEDLKIPDTEKAIRVAKELFGGDILREIEDVSGKTVLGMIEPVKILSKKHSLEVFAKIDTGAFRTSVCRTIAEQIGLNKKIIGEKRVFTTHGRQLRPLVPIIFTLAGKKIKTQCTIANRVDLKREMIIGRRDLKDFIIDPTKNIILKKINRSGK